MRKADSEWQVYRTRFLIGARQLTGPLEFRDALGREHRGQRGDYLVESSDGTQRIAPREIFEDVYVPMGSVVDKWPRTRRDFSISDSEASELGSCRDAGVRSSDHKIGTLADSGGTGCNRATPDSSVCHSWRSSAARNDSPGRLFVEKPGGGASIPLVKTGIQYMGIFP